MLITIVHQYPISAWNQLNRDDGAYCDDEDNDDNHNSNPNPNPNPNRNCNRNINGDSDGNGNSNSDSNESNDSNILKNVWEFSENVELNAVFCNRECSEIYPWDDCVDCTKEEFVQFVL